MELQERSQENSHVEPNETEGGKGENISENVEKQRLRQILKQMTRHLRHRMPEKRNCGQYSINTRLKQFVGVNYWYFLRGFHLEFYFIRGIHLEFHHKNRNLFGIGAPSRTGGIVF